LHAFQQIAARTISFDELSKHLIAAGKAKTDELLTLIDEASLLVMINDWPKALQLWQECQPVLREPLFALRALQEVKGISVMSRKLGDHSLSAHLEDLNRISCEFGLLLASHESEEEAADLLSFSNLLERRLAPWLKQLSDFFDCLREPGND
jgi:hypothetical protein